MARHELVEALANTDELPVAAIGGCLLRMDEVSPDLLAVVESAAAGTLNPADDILLFRVLHILGGARVERLHQPLMRLLRRPGEGIEELLGDATTETLGKIIAGGFNGDAGDLFDLLCTPDLNEFVRSSVFGAVAFLTWAGRIEESTTRDFLLRFDEQRPIPEGDHTWFSWSEVVELLGWEDMAPRVEQAYRDGRIPPEVSRLQNFRKSLAEAKRAAPGDDSRFQLQGNGYIEDVLVELERFGSGGAPDHEDVPEFDDPSPVRWAPNRGPHRNVGRNDPCPCGSGKKYKRCCLSV